MLLTNVWFSQSHVTEREMVCKALETLAKDYKIMCTILMDYDDNGSESSDPMFFPV